MVLVAGNKFTGTLTSPNDSVPDQNGRGPDRSSSTSAACFLLLGSALLLLQGFQTLLQNAVQRCRFPFRLHRGQTRCFALCFLLEEFSHPAAVLVFVIRRIKLALE